MTIYFLIKEIEKKNTLKNIYMLWGEGVEKKYA